MKDPRCTFCGEPGHYQSFCRRKPRPPIAVTKPLPRPTKPIAKVGKQGKRTAAAVAKWKRSQKPNDAGYFECYYCLKWIAYLVAEHYNSKARRPDLRTDDKNFVIACEECNRKKSSKNGDEFIRM